ncbi:MAG: hypothetical protein M3N15_04335 [Actinomycetota bacterium]|nr:hypothetical protein [Actinomycetota bacterium]
MRVAMLLADAAQAVGGKLYVLGGGWSVTGPGPSPMAIAIKIDVPWGQTDVRHRWVLDLVDQDGRPVLVPASSGPEPVHISGEFEVGRPPGLAEGTPIDLPLAISVGPLPLPPGTRCVWQLSIDGTSDPNWRLAFDIRPAR